MKPSSSKEERTEHQFDSFAKKTLSGEAKSYRRELAKSSDIELNFSDLSEAELNSLYTIDEYYSDYQHYDVYGYDIGVKNDMLIEALDRLPQKKRDIILLSYFLDLNDMEIGKLLDLVRTTVFRNRKDALKEMKEYINKGGSDDEEPKDEK